METLLYLTCTFLGTSVLICLGNMSLRRPYKKLAATFALKGLWPIFGIPEALRGSIDGYRLILERSEKQDASAVSGRMLIRIRLQKKMVRLLHVAPGGWLERFRTDDLQIEDSDFDKTFRLDGPDEALLAYLNSTRRDLLQAWKSRGLSIENGYLVVQSWRGTRLGRNLIQLVPELIDLAKNLDEGTVDLHQALVENARHDPHLPFRRKCLEVLLQDVDDHILVEEIARENLTHSDLGIRTLAGKALGEEGIPTLLSVLNANTDDEASVAAIKSIISLRCEEAEKRLVDALSMPNHRVVVEALRAIIAKQSDYSWSSWTDTAWRKRIPRLLLDIPLTREPETTDPELLGLVCEALALYCIPDEQEGAVTWLTHIAQDGLRSSPFTLKTLEKSIVALGQLGGRMNVELLAQLADEGKRPIRNAALKATRKIQERLGLSEGDGHLSLIESQGGEVSIAHDVGAVSVIGEAAYDEA
jgi:hypothetical protein